MTDYLSTIEIETAPNPTFSVIWLHGLGADGNDFVSILPELGLPASPAVRFIFPHAERIPVTCNNGFVMRAWYDIKAIGGLSRDVDEEGIRTSRLAIQNLIARENERGVATDHIFIAGFSQGGAMAYTVGVTHPEKLAGVIALSTYIPSISLLTNEMSEANRNIPIFAGHGISDGVVSLQMGTLARDALLEHNYAVEWRTYPMPHSVCMDEIADIGEWLTAKLV